MRSLIACGILLLTAGSASAAMTTYYHSGGWHAFSGNDADKHLVCGIGTDNQADGRTLNMTFVVGGDALRFEATKPGWNIPENLTVPVVLTVGHAAPWNFQASGHGTSLSWTLNAEGIRAFDPQFRRAEMMILSFPNGNEPPWTISLAGSTAADNTFARCISDLSRQMQSNPAAPTQPFGQGPTQPFTPAPAAPTTPQPKG